MPRYAKEGATVEDLKAKILETVKDKDFSGSVCTDMEYAVYTILSNPSKKVYDDIHKIEVDGENAALVGEFDLPGSEGLEPFEVLNGIPIAWCAMGGDWERPVIVVLYLGDKGELRAYVPEDGNAYNHEQKCAYGSEDNIAELKDDENYEDEVDKLYVFDVEKLRADVKSRIQLKSNHLPSKPTKPSSPANEEEK